MVQPQRRVYATKAQVQLYRQMIQLSCISATLSRNWMSQNKIFLPNISKIYLYSKCSNQVSYENKYIIFPHMIQIPKQNIYCNNIQFSETNIYFKQNIRSEYSQKPKLLISEITINIKRNIYLKNQNILKKTEFPQQGFHVYPILGISNPLIIPIYMSILGTSKTYNLEDTVCVSKVLPHSPGRRVIIQSTVHW